MNSPAAEAGVIPKDILISVDGQDLTKCTHDGALETLKRAPLKTFLELSRYFGPQKRQNINVVEQPELHLPRGAPDVQSLCSASSWNTATTYQTTEDCNRAHSTPTYNQSSERFTTVEQLTSVTHGRRNHVKMFKGAKGLGFSVGGGVGTNQMPHVKRIYSGSPAQKSGQLSPGDIIHSANGIDLSTLNHIEVVNVIRYLPLGEVSLIISRQQQMLPK